MNKLLNLISILLFFIIPFASIYLIKLIEPSDAEKISLQIITVLTLIGLIFYPTDIKEK